jgi:hypothetical protein
MREIRSGVDGRLIAATLQTVTVKQPRFTRDGLTSRNVNASGGTSMAATPASRTGTSGSFTSARSDARISTETKAAPKTTEFMAFVAVVAMILISAAMIKGGDSGGTDEFIARQAWLYVSIVTAAYMIGRGLAKSGSREPYFDNGTNEMRDRDGR